MAAAYLIASCVKVNRLTASAEVVHTLDTLGAVRKLAWTSKAVHCVGVLRTNASGLIAHASVGLARDHARLGGARQNASQVVAWVLAIYVGIASAVPHASSSRTVHAGSTCTVAGARCATGNVVGGTVRRVIIGISW